VEEAEEEEIEEEVGGQQLTKESSGRRLCEECKRRGRVVVSAVHVSDGTEREREAAKKRKVKDGWNFPLWVERAEIRAKKGPKRQPLGRLQ